MEDEIMTSSSDSPSDPNSTEKNTPEEEDHKNNVEELKDDRPGCKHYKRRCKVVSPCCGKTFWCRLCHAELMDELLLAKPDSEEVHEFDRSKISEIICAECDTRQPIANQCTNCKCQFASYYCNICKLWDDDGGKKKVYHCEQCGICRIGGRDNFFHCNKCACCLSIKMLSNHRCTEEALHRDCPVCLEYLLTSTKAVVFYKCGHAIHEKCSQDLIKQYSVYARCPTCCKYLYNLKSDREEDANHQDEDHQNTEDEDRDNTGDEDQASIEDAQDEPNASRDENALVSGFIMESMSEESISNSSSDYSDCNVINTNTQNSPNCEQ